MKYGSIKKTNLSTKLFFFAIIVAVFFFTFSRNTVEGMTSLVTLLENVPVIHRNINKNLDKDNLQTDNDKLIYIKNIYKTYNDKHPNKNLQHTSIVNSTTKNTSEIIKELKLKLGIE